MSEDWIADVKGSRRQVLLLAIAVEGGMGLVAMAAGWWLGLPVADWVVWSGRGLVAGMAGAALMLAGLGILRVVPLEPLQRLRRLVDQLVNALFGSCRWWELLLVAVLAGWGEELLFRGVIQGGIDGWLDSRIVDAPAWVPATVALATASILFGLAHCLSLEYAIFATLVGAFLGGMAIVTGDLLAPIVAHAAYDFVALMVLRREPGARGVVGVAA